VSGASVILLYFITVVVAHVCFSLLYSVNIFYAILPFVFTVEARFTNTSHHEQIF
jgi:hypothetical protein